MPNGLGIQKDGLGIQKETYVDSNERTFKALTYDMLTSINSNICLKHEDHEKRIKKLEKKKLRDTATSASTGLIGGFLAMLGIKWFG